MYYIDDIHPVRIIDYWKYMHYVALRKERERFLKESRCVCHAEWLIHKKLYQERYGKAYLYLARGNGKWRTIDRILDLIEEGRDVTVMNARTAFKKPTQLGCYRYLHDPIMDRLYEEFRRQMITDWTKDYIYPLEFKPMVEPDAYVIGNHYIYNNYLWSDLAINIIKESTQELIEVVKGESNDSLQSTS